MAGKSATTATNGINVIPQDLDTHLVIATKELGFVSGIFIGAKPDHDGLFDAGLVWLAIQTGKDVKTLYIGEIVNGRFDPIADLQSESKSSGPIAMSVSDFAAFVSGDRQIGKLAVCGLSETLTRLVRRYARADYQDYRATLRAKSEATSQAKADARLAAVKSAIGAI